MRTDRLALEDPAILEQPSRISTTQSSIELKRDVACHGLLVPCQHEGPLSGRIDLDRVVKELEYIQHMLAFDSAGAGLAIERPSRVHYDGRPGVNPEWTLILSAFLVD